VEHSTYMTAMYCGTKNLTKLPNTSMTHQSMCSALLWKTKSLVLSFPKNLQ